MGPRSFVTCYVCSKEFGSRSIPLHEPKCLERWRSSNKKLPPEKRTPTPVRAPAAPETTSKRSVRPQTKILRRPTPNLKHPVIAVDSDGDSGDGEGSHKGDVTPKRLKTTPKNFIRYNKYNVDKNTKRERSSPAAPAPPDPCHSCSRNVAPERLHSHAKRDSRGLMHPRRTDKKPPKAPKEEEVEGTGTCYVCQAEVAVSALMAHEGECLERWKKENNSLSPHLRKLPPRKPDGAPGPGDDPAWAAVQSQLVPCPVCGRTFFPERLPVHQKVCKGPKAQGGPATPLLKRASSLREASATRREDNAQQPESVYVSCCLCGRSYGSWVIAMHETQCLRKMRPPEDADKTTPGTSPDEEVASLVELGDHAWESHLQQLVPCPRCSRTFFPDRLGVHERSCKGVPANRRPRSNKGA